MKNIELVSKICSVAGAPGHEKKIRDFIIGEIKKEGLGYTLDNLGNLIVKIKGKKEKSIMVAAHMDEIGFIVKHIDEKGFVFFHPLGGFDPKTLTSQRVVIHGIQDVLGVMGSKPIHIMSAEDRKKTPKIEDYFIDTGLKKEELEKKISVGDPITRYSAYGVACCVIAREVATNPECNLPCCLATSLCSGCLYCYLSHCDESEQDAGGFRGMHTYSRTASAPVPNHLKRSKPKCA